jgi:hypothetical protein
MNQALSYFRAHLAPDLQLPTVLREVADEHARFTHKGSQLQTRTLVEVSDRLPGLPMNHLANADGRMPIASGTEQPTENKSVENLAPEITAKLA